MRGHGFAYVPLPIPQLQISCHFMVWESWSGKQIVSDLAECSSASYTSSSSSRLFFLLYLVSCSDHLSLSALSRSSTCKYIKNAIRFHSHISLVYWLLCKAEKGFSGSMWPLNYATSKPWRLNQHFLLSYILASFPNKGDVSVCGRLKCRWIQEA